MTQHQNEQQIAELVEITGAAPEDIWRRLQDDDLFVLSPEQRFALEGEDAVQQWTYAMSLVNSLQDLTTSEIANDAIRMLFWDLAERCALMLERTEQRLAEAPTS